MIEVENKQIEEDNIEEQIKRSSDEELMKGEKGGIEAHKSLGFVSIFFF